jgi:hypothetical protein
MRLIASRLLPLAGQDCDNTDLTEFCYHQKVNNKSNINL